MHYTSGEKVENFSHPLHIFDKNSSTNEGSLGGICFRNCHFQMIKTQLPHNHLERFIHVT